MLGYRGKLARAVDCRRSRFAQVAAVLRNETDSAAALAAFDRSETARRLARDAPDNLVSLRRFFGYARPLMIASLLEAIADDGPGVSEDEVAGLRAPTLVIGTVADLIHPIEFARTLADRIPTAFLVEVTLRPSIDSRYVREVQEALEAFLNEHISPGRGPIRRDERIVSVVIQRPYIRQVYVR
jgi:pimeloyl-ACP methyl ester carboxylesterase